jgi:hypothetical protein
LSTSENTPEDTNQSRRNAEIEAKLEARKKAFESEPEQETPKVNQVSEVKQADILEEQDKGIFFDKKKYPLYSNEEYNRYLSYNRGQRQKYIAEELSKKDKHIVPLYVKNSAISDDSQDPLLNPDIPFTEDNSIDSHAIEQKEFEFHDASVKHFKIMQNLDDEFSRAVQEVINATSNVLNARNISAEEYQRLSDNLRRTEDKRYRFGARLFWRMTDDEYDRATNLQHVKDLVDAAIHRSTNTIPNYTAKR